MTSPRAPWLEERGICPHSSQKTQDGAVALTIGSGRGLLQGNF